MTPVRDEDFKELVLASSVPALVLFERYGWGTAEIMRCILERLGQEHAQEIRVFAYSLDTSSKIAHEFQVEDSITILFFKNGQLKMRMGARPREEIDRMIRSLVE